MELNTVVFCNKYMHYIFSIQFSLCNLFDSLCVLMPVSWFDLSCMLTFGGGVAQQQVDLLLRDQADSLPSRLRHVQLKAKRNPVKKHINSYKITEAHCNTQSMMKPCNKPTH